MALYYNTERFTEILRDLNSQLSSENLSIDNAAYYLKQRHGIEKDERSIAIERSEIEMIQEDKVVEEEILERNIKQRASLILKGSSVNKKLKDLIKDCDQVVAAAAKIGGISYFHKYAYDLISENERIIASTFDASIYGFKFHNLEKINVISSEKKNENYKTSSYVNSNRNFLNFL